MLKKRSKMFFFCKKIGMIEKILASFQKQKTRQTSFRRPTKSSYSPRILKKIRLWVFLEKRDEFFQKKPNENFRKRLILQVFLSKCVSIFTTAHEVSRRSKFWVFWKKRRFLFEKFLQLYKITQQRYFPSEGVLKIVLAYAISKRQILRFSRKNDVFLSEKSLKFFKSTLLRIFYLESVWSFQVA